MSQPLPHTFGHYALLHVLGRGGSGTAYLAVPLAARTQVLVVKVLHPAAAEDALDRARFEHEAKLAVATNIDALATVYDVGLVGETPYIAMELVRGMSLSKLLSALKEREAFLAIPDVLTLIGSALEGVKGLHEAKDEHGRELMTIHRDLSPNNLVLDANGRMRILDLGMGRSRLREKQTQTGVIIGTPSYMSPEQVLGGSMTQRSDVYTIGTIFWELLAGRRYIPKRELSMVLAETVKRVFEPPSAFRAGLSERFDDLCRRALEREPDRRLTAAEMLAGIEALKGAALEYGTATPLVPLSELFHQDLGAEQLESLLGQYREAIDEPTSPKTVVIARRPLSDIAPTAAIPPKELPLAAVFVVVLGLAAGLLVWALWLDRSAPEIPAAFEAEEIPLEDEEPSVDPRTREPEIVPAEAPPPEAEPEPPPISAPDAGARTVARDRPAPRAPDDGKARPPAGPEPTVDELMASLQKHARALKQARPELAPKIDELINAGLFETAGGDTPAVRARIAELSKQLRRLKESGEKREARPDR